MLVPHLLLAKASWLLRHSTVTGWYLAMVLASRAMQLLTAVSQPSQTRDDAPKARITRSCGPCSSGMYQLPARAAGTRAAPKPRPSEAAAPIPLVAISCLMKSRRVDMVGPLLGGRLAGQS
ncbi:hypothetical protein D3C72_1896960 [compost metagenome]